MYYAIEMVLNNKYKIFVCIKKINEKPVDGNFNQRLFTYVWGYGDRLWGTALEDFRICLCRGFEPVCFVFCIAASDVCVHRPG